MSRLASQRCVLWVAVCAVIAAAPPAQLKSARDVATSAEALATQIRELDAADLDARHRALQLAWGSLVPGSTTRGPQVLVGGCSIDLPPRPPPTRGEYSIEFGDRLRDPACISALFGAYRVGDEREALFASLILDRLADRALDAAWLAIERERPSGSAELLIAQARGAAVLRRSDEFETRATQAVSAALAEVDDEARAWLVRVAFADGDWPRLTAQLDGEPIAGPSGADPSGLFSDRMLLALRVLDEGRSADERGEPYDFDRERTLLSARYAVGRWLDSVAAHGLPLVRSEPPLALQRIAYALCAPAITAGREREPIAAHRLREPPDASPAVLSFADERALVVFVRWLSTSKRARAVAGIARILARHPELWETAWPVLVADWWTTAPAVLDGCSSYEPEHWISARHLPRQGGPWALDDAAPLPFGLGALGRVDELYRAAEFLGVERMLAASEHALVTTRLYALLCLAKLADVVPPARARLERAVTANEPCLADAARELLR